ncbi:DNA gyrase subunit A [Salinigranum rubrum]|uniref:DNA gyrase subunit A n=1 Tax=Salinigranum rubrum TaxID=755307 RepID=A0A2I8VIZ4_9EURY|nr:DNA gyrase subunit A [Salinigranum rubrum]AUV81864.1 DNA gyrase subunit A [Salinigranum rubrum]
MSSDSDPKIAAQVENARIEQEMEQSYIDYAMSVIAGRALPDVRDGLKPVHRRILYAMHQAGISSGSSHRKSSSIVGETMGDYHPHGDSAIYDTLTRMAQDFSMRYPLVDGQGNFGSVDGDPAAAMRYTEARMSSIAEELLEDIEKDTVDFQSNYDDRTEEPTVLPAAFPNLLVNGSSGIAVGMSTNIPPHNLGEVIDATVKLIDDPDCGVEDLVDTRDGRGNGSDGPVKGPDFPTGANIVGKNAVHKAYTTGRGRIRVRADFEVTEERIVLNELPYQENKARLIKRIADDVNDGSLEGIRDIRDESDRDGIRVVIELKRNADPQLVKNHLLSSHLESTFGVINLALVDGEPRVLDLKQTLVEYLEHRKEVVRRRSEYDLAEAEDRAHILEGRLTALEHVDSVVDIIRDADDRDGAKAALREAYGFSEAQVDHIVSMQLGSLTSMETEAIETEYEEVQATIERLETILGDESELLGVIEEELLEIKDRYGDDRRTNFVENDGEVTREDLVPEEDVVVVVTEDDYVKQMPLSWFRAQRRGGKGIIGSELKQGDKVASVFVANTHDYLLCFTDRGQVYKLKTYQLPRPETRYTRGSALVNYLDLDAGEEIQAVVNCDDLEVNDDDDEGDEKFLTMVTRGGRVKRTNVDRFQNILSTGIRAITLEEGDELADVEVTDGRHDLIVSSERGMSIRFDEEEVRAMGRSARGVGGIDLREGDRVAGLAAVDEGRHDWTLTVTRNGYGKRTKIADYRKQSRNGKGLIDIKTEGRNGPVCTIETVGRGDHIVVMSEKGQIIRTAVDDLSVISRNTKGVTVMDVEDGDAVGAVSVVPAAVAQASDDDGDGDKDGDGDESAAEQ